MSAAFKTSASFPNTAPLAGAGRGGSGDPLPPTPLETIFFFHDPFGSHETRRERMRARRARVDAARVDASLLRVDSTEARDGDIRGWHGSTLHLDHSGDDGAGPILPFVPGASVGDTQSGKMLDLLRRCAGVAEDNTPPSEHSKHLPVRSKMASMLCPPLLHTPVFLCSPRTSTSTHPPWLSLAVNVDIDPCEPMFAWNLPSSPSPGSVESSKHLASLLSFKRMPDPHRAKLQRISVTAATTPLIIDPPIFLPSKSSQHNWLPRIAGVHWLSPTANPSGPKPFIDYGRYSYSPSPGDIEWLSSMLRTLAANATAGIIPTRQDHATEDRRHDSRAKTDFSHLTQPCMLEVCPILQKEECALRLDAMEASIFDIKVGTIPLHPLPPVETLEEELHFISSVLANPVALPLVVPVWKGQNATSDFVDRLFYLGISHHDVRRHARNLPSLQHSMANTNNLGAQLTLACERRMLSSPQPTPHSPPPLRHNIKSKRKRRENTCARMAAACNKEPPQSPSSVHLSRKQKHQHLHPQDLDGPHVAQRQPHKSKDADASRVSKSKRKRVDQSPSCTENEAKRLSNAKTKTKPGRQTKSITKKARLCPAPAVPPPQAIPEPSSLAQNVDSFFDFSDMFDATIGDRRHKDRARQRFERAKQQRYLHAVQQSNQAAERIPSHAISKVGVDPNEFGMMAFRRQESLHSSVRSNSSTSSGVTGSSSAEAPVLDKTSAENESRPHVRIICDHSQIESPLVWRALENGPNFRCEFVERPLPPPLFVILDASVCVAVISDQAVIQASQGEDGADSVRLLCENMLRAVSGFEIVWVIIDCQAMIEKSDRITTERRRGLSSQRNLALGRLQKWLHQIKAASHVDFRFRYLCNFALGTLVLILEEAIKASMERHVEIRTKNVMAMVNTAKAGGGGGAVGEDEAFDVDNWTNRWQVAWRSRSFLREMESDKERFLITIPGINSFTAQMLLDECSFVDLLHWPEQTLASISQQLPTVSKATISAVRAALT